MKNLALLIILVLVIILPIQTTIVPHVGKATPKIPPKLQLNLDLPPIQRWVEIAKMFKTELQQTFGMIDFFLDQIPFGDQLFKEFKMWSKYRFPYQEMAEEVMGIANASGVEYDKVLFMNFVYEISQACTGLVMRSSNGTIFHGRNMDFFFWEQFSKLVAEVELYKNNEYVCTINSVVGSVFALTGYKRGKFAINEDTRHEHTKDSFIDILKNLFLKEYMPSAWLLRKVLEEEESYQSAVQRLSSVNITAPIYFIVSGLNPNEGCVIERKSIGVHATYTLSDTTWFLVQTNYDRDEEDPLKDRRRIPAEQKLEELGNNISIDDLFSKVMSQWPNFNIATILTMTAVPSTGFHQLKVWYGVKSAEGDEEQTKFLE